MVKFNIDAFRYLTQQHFRLLTAVEMGMKNHELVPLALVSSIAGIHRGATARILNDLTRSRLAAYERGKKFDGYRLTTLGYDFLALRALCSKDVVASIGNQIGVGKESDIYVGGDYSSHDLVLKFHRLGRTSFRKIKEKRDYHQRRHFCSWLYLSRLAAAREFSFLSTLYSHQFPVPRPVEICRHTVVMELITGPTLCNVSQLKSPEILYDKLMQIIIKLASYGLIHADFNEFNIMLMEDENPIIIDFPQMVSIEHPNAQFYFDRDVQCIRTFFQRRFHFDGEEWPEFKDIKREHNLDIELDASGFKKLNKTLNKAYDEGDFEAHLQEKCVDEDENLNEEEEKTVEKDDDIEFKLVGSSQQFQNWLEQVQNDLETLTVEEGKISVEQLERIIGEEREAKAKEIMGRIRKEADAKTMVGKTVDDNKSMYEIGFAHRDIKSANFVSGQPRTQNVGVANSIMSTSTIIPKEEIQRRLLMERRKAKKEKLRIKGQQCAVRTSRKENRQVIKEYEGWDEY